MRSRIVAVIHQVMSPTTGDHIMLRTSCENIITASAGQGITSIPRYDSDMEGRSSRCVTVSIRSLNAKRQILICRQYSCRDGCRSETHALPRSTDALNGQRIEAERWINHRTSSTHHYGSRLGIVRIGRIQKGVYSGPLYGQRTIDAVVGQRQFIDQLGIGCRRIVARSPHIMKLHGDTLTIT
ncbi:hypothetical protein D3C80_979910 [compost metagenome]